MGACCSSSSSSSSSSSMGTGRSRKKRKLEKSIFSSAGNSGFEESELHRNPDRKFVNSFSECACLHTQQGMKGTNQDAMLVWENFSSQEDTIFCGVFDGHGPYGHLVSKKVRDSLPLKLCAQWKVTLTADQNNSMVGDMDSEETSISMDDEWCHSTFDENAKLPEIFLHLRRSFLKAFKLMDKELKLHPAIDCFCSGTTAVTIVKQGRDLVIGNVGDSRAVLGMRDKDNSLTAVQLTVDLKPNLPREAARIQKCNGRVFSLQDEPEVARVWLPNNDSPGLAMARAFGDFCLKDFGLISVPDVSYRYLTEKDEFIVLATDGVWDVLSNKEVVDIVALAPTRTTAARAVVECAIRAWRLKFPTSKSDDCAVICLFLDQTYSSSHVQDEGLEKAEPTISAAEGLSASDSDLPVDCGQDPTPHVTHGSTNEIVPVSEVEEKLQIRSQSMRSLAECISTAEEEEWSALEGVTRVNSLLNLPRFPQDDKRVANWIKWF